MTEILLLTIPHVSVTCKDYKENKKQERNHYYLEIFKFSKLNISSGNVRKIEKINNCMKNSHKYYR